MGPVMESLRRNFLLVATIGAVLVGALLGFVFRFQQPSPTTVMLISFPGELLMNMLKMMILPLIVSSLISGEFGPGGAVFWTWVLQPFEISQAWRSWTRSSRGAWARWRFSTTWPPRS